MKAQKPSFKNRPENRSQPEVQELPEVGLKLDLASRWKRLGGALIDIIIILLIMWPIIYFLRESLVLTEGQESGLVFIFSNFIISWAIFIMINGYFLYYGQTIGKKLVKTRIVDRNGNVPTFWRIIILRYLAIHILMLILREILSDVGGWGFLGLLEFLLIYGQTRRCLHDYIAGTFVVNTK